MDQSMRDRLAERQEQTVFLTLRNGSRFKALLKCLSESNGVWYVVVIKTYQNPINEERLGTTASAEMVYADDVACVEPAAAPPVYPFDHLLSDNWRKFGNVCC